MDARRAIAHADLDRGRIHLADVGHYRTGALPRVARGAFDDLSSGHICCSLLDGRLRFEHATHHVPFGSTSAERTPREAAVVTKRG